MFSITSFLLTAVETIVTLVIIFVVYIAWNQQYWKRRNLPYLVPPFPFGIITNQIRYRETIGLRLIRTYNQARSKGWKHCGIFLFTRPVYMPLDLDYLKNIMTKDFQYFADRGTFYNERDDPLTAHLFNLEGTKWRNLRAKLTPTFTSGKMKIMFQTLVDCEVPLLKAMDDYVDKREAVDIKEMFARFTTDIIGSCAFGLECDSFTDEDSPFRKYGRKMFQLPRLRSLLFTIALNYPNLARTFRLRFLPADVSDFFMNIVRGTVAYREKNHIKRNDFLQMLMDMKSDDDKHDGTTLTMNELAAQCFVFFAAGFETSSTTSSFVFYELAKHQDIQQKVRDEIELVLAKHDGRVTYEAINEMKYMSQVVDEALRKYPPVPFLVRLCVKDYAIPETDVVLEKGTRLMIPIWGIQKDPEYYPDPDKFDPNRFSDSNKHKRHQYAHLPFGEGPRSCIGNRFGLMQTKVGLTALIRNYKFTINRKTQEPIKFVPTSFILTIEGGLWLDVEKIRK